MVNFKGNKSFFKTISFIWLAANAPALKSLKNSKIFILCVAPTIILGIAYIALFVVGIYNFDVFLGSFPAWLLSYSLKDGVLNGIVYALLCLFAFIGMIVAVSFAVGIISLAINLFLSPLIVGALHKIHYPNVVLNPPAFMESIKISLGVFIRTLIKFLLLSAMCLIFTLIGLGFISMIISMILYYRFYTINLNYEVALNIMSGDEYEIFKQHNAIPLFFLNMLIVIPLYIPIISLFALPWQILALSHFMLNWYSQYSSNGAASEINETIEIYEIR